MYFLYRHIRLDKNEVFYIGIGTVDTKATTYVGAYYRAYNKKKSRNQHWLNIVNKTDYKVEILFETENLEEIQEKEKEFISLYSTLCNMTEGGFGISSYKHKENTKKSISKSLKGRKKSKEHADRINKAKLKSVIMYNDTERHEFSSRTEAAKYLGNINLRANISRSLKSGVKVHGYTFEEITESKDKEL